MGRLLLLAQAARASNLRCEPHRLLTFNTSHTGFYPSLNLRSTFAEGSVVIRLMRLVKKIGKGCGTIPITFAKVHTLYKCILLFWRFTKIRL